MGSFTAQTSTTLTPTSEIHGKRKARLDLGKPGRRTGHRVRPRGHWSGSNPSRWICRLPVRKIHSRQRHPSDRRPPPKTGTRSQNRWASKSLPRRNLEPEVAESEPEPEPEDEVTLSKPSTKPRSTKTTRERRKKPKTSHSRNSLS